MNKKIMIGGGILAVAVTVILIFTLSGGSSKKNMIVMSERDLIVGEWDFPMGILQFDNDGTAYMDGPREYMEGTWYLSGDEKILAVEFDNDTEEFGLTSVSEDELCLSYREERNCFNRYYGEEAADDSDYYYGGEAADDGDYYYEEEIEEERYYDVYGREHNHISTCYTCGISYTVQTLPYLGKYCSQTCCGAYERDLRDCGY